MICNRSNSRDNKCAQSLKQLKVEYQQSDFNMVKEMKRNLAHILEIHKHDDGT